MDFKQIKEKLKIKDVLAYYGLLDGLKESGIRIRGACPIHKGDNKTAFNADIEKNLYYCFTRHHGGSVIDLIMEIERIPFKEAVKKAMEILVERIKGISQKVHKLRIEPELIIRESATRIKKRKR